MQAQKYIKRREFHHVSKTSMRDATISSPSLAQNCSKLAQRTNTSMLAEVTKSSKKTQALKQTVWNATINGVKRSHHVNYESDACVCQRCLPRIPHDLAKWRTINRTPATARTDLRNRTNRRSSPAAAQTEVVDHSNQWEKQTRASYHPVGYISTLHVTNRPN